jgi:hypothetical protein
MTLVIALTALLNQPSPFSLWERGQEKRLPFLSRAPSPFYLIDTSHQSNWPDDTRSDKSQQLIVGSQGYELYLAPNSTLEVHGTTHDGWMLGTVTYEASGALTMVRSEVIAHKDGTTVRLPALTEHSRITDVRPDGAILVRANTFNPDFARDHSAAQNDEFFVWKDTVAQRLPSSQKAGFLKTGAISGLTEVFIDGLFALQEWTIFPTFPKLDPSTAAPLNPLISPPIAKSW